MSHLADAKVVNIAKGDPGKVGLNTGTAYIVPTQSRLYCCAALLQCVTLRLTVCTTTGSAAVPVGLPLNA